MENKIKICHVISGYFRNDPRVFQRQCKSIIKAEYEVSILTNDGGSNEILDDIYIYSCGRFWKNRIKIILFAKHQFFKKAIEIDADIYQLHSPELISLGLELKRRGKIIIYDAHEDLPKHILEKDWIPSFLRKPISLIIDAYMKRALKKYDEIISPHSHVVDYLVNVNKNVTLITNFAKFDSSLNYDLSHYLSRENSICYSGTVYLHSNQEFILDAISNIENLKYQIVGFIDKNHKKQLSERKGFEKLLFLDRIPWEELNNFYSKSLIGMVIIDYKQNLGNKKGTYAVNKMFEYMQAGLPIICSDYDLWKDVVNKYKCGICVEPQNTRQIEDAIRYLIGNKEKAYEMGQNGRKGVREEYNWSTQEREYLKIFRKYEK
jgi:glycosyltransferase involved in cell wall biosynthesis